MHADPLKGMVPGDSLQLLDAQSLKSIGREFTMPESARTTALEFHAAGQVVNSFRDFLKQKGGSDSPANIPGLVSSFREKVSSGNAQVLVIGSPLYHDDVPIHDMREGWLSDGYMAKDPSVTVFSTTTKNGALRNAPIRFCTLSDDVWGTENKGSHQEMTKRFWSIYIHQCGGRLVSFQSDIPTSFKALLATDLPDLVEANNYKIDPNDTALEIRKSRGILKSAPTPTVTETPAETSATNTVEPVVTTTNVVIDIGGAEFSWLTQNADAYRRLHPGPSSLPAKGKVLIGLVWDTQTNPPDTDLDLHVRKTGSKEELYFAHTKTPDGRHFKDFSNPTASHGFELVDIDVPVNPKELEMYVNSYAGAGSQGFNGELRVLFDGKLYNYPFSIPSHAGNHGSEVPNRDKNPNWVRISCNP